MRILLVDNLMIRRYGKTRMLPGRKLMCGCIRNNWRLCEFSDRDITRYLAPFGMRAVGAAIANRKLIRTAINFRPDAVLVGHCDYITNETLCEIRALLPKVKIAHFNIDAIWQDWTCRQIERRVDSCDAIFITSAGEKLKKWTNGKNVIAYMPNPADPSMETGDNSRKTSAEFDRDFFFAGIPREGDPRFEVMQAVREALKTSGVMRYDFFGMDRPAVLGADYEDVLLGSKMSINLNRRDDWKWYSSDRIAHLFGNGILTFMSDNGQMRDFFGDGDCVFYSDTRELIDKLFWYNDHDAERRRIAGNGREKYHRMFSGARVLKYMIETMFGEEYSQPYEWRGEVYR